MVAPAATSVDTWLDLVILFSVGVGLWVSG